MCTSKITRIHTVLKNDSNCNCFLSDIQSKCKIFEQVYCFGMTFTGKHISHISLGNISHESRTQEVDPISTVLVQLIWICFTNFHKARLINSRTPPEFLPCRDSLFAGATNFIWSVSKPLKSNVASANVSVRHTKSNEET